MKAKGGAIFWSAQMRKKHRLGTQEQEIMREDLSYEQEEQCVCSKDDE